jgi:UDP:flavonoid glycosyltransferase YjiC (YdhE family)
VSDRTAAIFIPGRPLLLNAERSRHWREHRLATADTRMEASYLWQRFTNAGAIQVAKVDVYPTYEKGRLPDTGSCVPAVKAIIDGAVDARLLVDDHPAIVTYIGFHRPVIDRERGDGVMVVLEELEEGSPWAQ